MGPDDESLGRYLRETASLFTNADSKLWRSLRGLFRPGVLTAAYFAGQRRLYVHPVRLFLIVNVMFFFVISGVGGSAFRGALSSHRGAAVYGAAASRLAEGQQQKWGVDRETYERAFNQKADTLAPSLIVVMVPVLALLLAGLMWPVRASGLRHLVLATHAVTWMMIVVIALLFIAILLLLIADGLGYTDARSASVDPILAPAVTMSILAYLAVSFRRVYAVPWWGAGLASLAISTAGMMAALLVFRGVLFAATWALLRAPA